MNLGFYNIPIAPEMHKRLKRQAVELEIPMRQLTEQALDQYLTQLEEANQPAKREVRREVPSAG